MTNRKSNEWVARFIAHDTPANLVAGQSTTVNLKIENIGLAKWTRNGNVPVHLGYKWFDENGTPVDEVDNRRTGLPTDLYPRQETLFGAVLVAPSTPGLYKLQWDLVVGGGKWFSDAGNPSLIVPVRVTDAPHAVTGWRVESNLNIANVTRTLDGDALTFWDSSVAQARGQWFRLNLGSPRVIDGIQFLSPGKGFPQAYVLHISPDGRNWTEITRVESDNQYDVMAIFTPQLVQYAQINLLGSAQSTWMISEILVHAATAWTANASHNAKHAHLAIDNSSQTAWSSQVAQSKEMWFSIDLGSPETISGLTLVSPDEGIAASYRVAVWNAGAHRWQVVAETLNNAAPVDIEFDALQTQFISVQLLQASRQPWIIQRARISHEMEHWLGPRA